FHTAPTEIHPLSLHDALPIFKVEFDHRLRLVDRVQLAVRLAIGPATLGHVAADLQDHLDIALRVEDRRVAGLQPYRTADAQGNVDRKSTRLNSSHVEISYAVF